MKQVIFLGILLFMGCALSFAGNPVLLKQAPVSAGKTAQAFADDGLGDQQHKKKKKKKKKKKGGYEAFQHGAGVTLFMAPATAAEAENGASNVGGTYFPSIQLKNMGNKSLRLAANPSLGFSFKSSSEGGASSGSFLFELPVALELHLGEANDEAFGGHVGVGFAYNRMAGTGLGANTAFGPHFSAGARWSMIGRNWGARANFLLNLKKGNDLYGYAPKNVFSLSLCNYF